MTNADIRDLTIIGAGPVGLSAAFWAGMREASSRIVDSLPEIGGQCTALYPEKWIYDVPGFDRLLARELVQRLSRQAVDQFDVPVHLETTAAELLYERDHDGDQVLRLVTDRGDFLSRALIIAGGHGAFEPKKMPGLDLSAWEGRGVSYFVADKAQHADQRVIVAGGGDSACDWALDLLDVAASVTLVHRRNEFRAHDVTIARLRQAEADGRCTILTPCEVVAVDGDHALTSVEVERPGGVRMRLGVDALLVQFGFKTALGPLRAWPLDVERGAIRVDSLGRTAMPNVWACGDIATHHGKLKLIATGFAEAALAVAQAVHALRPEVGIQPRYSTNTGVPGAVAAHA